MRLSTTVRTVSFACMATPTVFAHHCPVQFADYDQRNNWNIDELFGPVPKCIESENHDSMVIE